MSQIQTTVVNLFAGPGAGKSTVAAGLFSLLKQKKYSCELVTEYAKDLTWDGSQNLLENQVKVFAEQFTKQFRLSNQVTYIVSDSPLMLGYVYAHEAKRMKQLFSPDYIEALRSFIMTTFHQFDNVNFLIERTKEYDPKGRNQTLEESMRYDRAIEFTLNDFNIPYTKVRGTEAEIIQTVYNKLTA